MIPKKTTRINKSAALSYIRNQFLFLPSCVCTLPEFRSLNKLVAGEPKRWDQLLQGTMFALRTKPQLTTKFSPYYLMFGREARYPSEVPKEYEVRSANVLILLNFFYFKHLCFLYILMVFCGITQKTKSAAWWKGRISLRDSKHRHFNVSFHRTNIKPRKDPQEETRPWPSGQFPSGGFSF